MANSKKRCKHCKSYFEAESMVVVPAGTFCTYEHATEWVKTKAGKASEEKVRKSSNIEAKKAIVPRSKLLSRLQTLVNQWIVHVRDKYEPCCTCGELKESIKYDAGHMISRGASPALRFELTNIHKQCSVKCNIYGSGKRKEYELFIVSKYGKDHLDWLNGPHPSLKEKFPDNESIKKEITLYRKILRDAGLRPNL